MARSVAMVGCIHFEESSITLGFRIDRFITSMWINIDWSLYSWFYSTLDALADTQRLLNLRYLWGLAMASINDLLYGISYCSLPAGFSKEIIILIDESSFAIKSAIVSTRNLSNRFLVLWSSFRENFSVMRVVLVDRPVLLMNILPSLSGWSVAWFVRGIK